MISGIAAGPREARLVPWHHHRSALLSPPLRSSSSTSPAFARACRCVLSPSDRCSAGGSRVLMLHPSKSTNRKLNFVARSRDSAAVAS